MKSLLTLSIAMIISLAAYSQTSSRNGFWLHNRDTIRVFLVFAEVTGYSWDTPEPDWPAGEIPPNADDYFDPYFTGEENKKIIFKFVL